MQKTVEAPIFLQLYSGASFNLSGPVSPLDIDDVAAALAKINRFAGATTTPYSVAQHCLHVSEILEAEGHSAAIQMAGLLHDAHEIVTGDIPTPTKRLLGRLLDTVEQDLGNLLGALEQDLDDRILCALKLPDLDLRSFPVVQADMKALATERRDLLNPGDREWNLKLPEPDEKWIHPMWWTKAARHYAVRFRKLRARAQQNSG